MAMRLKKFVSARSVSTALTVIDTWATGTNAVPGFEGRFGNKAVLKFAPTDGATACFGVYSCASTATDASATALLSNTTSTVGPALAEITIPRYLGVKSPTTHSGGTYDAWLEA